MEKYINYITELAATMVVDGTANVNNALELALEKDNDMTLKAIEDLNDMQRGYVNGSNKTQKAYQIMLVDVYNNLK